MNKHNEHVSLLTALQKEGLAEGQLRRREGTCYRAAGWQEAGATTGHSRAGGDYYHAGAGLRNLWLKPLHPAAARHWRGPLESLPPECRPAQPLATIGGKHPQLESLFAAFARVPDPRARNCQHRLPTVLTLATVTPE